MYMNRRLRCKLHAAARHKCPRMLAGTAAPQHPKEDCSLKVIRSLYPFRDDGLATPRSVLGSIRVFWPSNECSMRHMYVFAVRDRKCCCVSWTDSPKIGV